MNGDNKSMEVGRLVKEIIKKWWILLLALIFFSTASYYFTTYMVTPVYRASSTIFIGRDPGGLTELTIAEVTLGQTLAADYRELVMTNLVMREVLTGLPAEHRDVNIRGNLSVHVIPDSRFMRISFDDAHPERAMLFVNKLSEVLIDQAENIVGVKNIQIVDHAQLPHFPVRPNLANNVVVAGLLGLILAALIILFRLIYSDTIQKQEDIERDLALTVLGIIPKYKENGRKNKALASIHAADSFMAERYRIFRTNLGYLDIDSELKTIIFTSTMAEEGKTNSVANMAVTIAASGKRVLLIDCDLRKGRINHLFNLKRSPGLTNCLVNKLSYNEALNQVLAAENLHILTTGALPPNPADILSSAAFEKFIDEVREGYDYILLDAPPVLSFADTAVICRVADGVVLVAAANETQREELKDAQRALVKAGARILGVLLTKADLSNRRKYYAYHAVD